MHLRHVHPVQLPANLSLIAPWLEKLERDTGGRLTARETIDRFQTGFWQCWLVMDGDECVALVTTELIEDDSGEITCALRTIEGTGMRRWRHLKDSLEDWARDEGATRMTSLALPAIARAALPDYEVTHLMVEKAL